MKVFVLNCGSSSIKYQVFDVEDDKYELLAKGLLERIGIPNSELKHQPTGKDAYKLVHDVPDHTVGINLILEALMHKEHGVLTDKNEINAVGHRVVHGGEKFSGSVRITQEVIDMLEECVELAPLHNPANLMGIYAISKLLPDVVQCGIFDTSFHHSMPEKAYMYALPYRMYEKHKIRRYGFHGTSHRYVSKKAANILGMDYNKMNMITCHLGNGASIAAIKQGKSFDTSMGLTPVEGLMMGTRVGDVDAGVLLYMMAKENLDLKKANSVINKESGVFGISGVSSDMRDIENAAYSGNKRAMLALDMYDYRVTKYIGAYAAAMGGVDAIIFTGGIGENDFILRKEVCKNLGFMGAILDEKKNDGLRGKDAIISVDDAKVKILVVTTNEELVIAQDSYEIVTRNLDIL
jgi:acetate kinase